MNKPHPGRHLLTDILRQMDEARSARPHALQQPSEMVREATNALPVKLEKSRHSGGRVRPDQQLHHDQKGEWMAPKRELIDTGTDKRYLRRNKLAPSFVESDDVGRSLAADRRQHAKIKAGYEGDRPRPKAKRRSRFSESRRSEACPQEIEAGSPPTSRRSFPSRSAILLTPGRTVRQVSLKEVRERTDQTLRPDWINLPGE